jgi:hypothetical protein
MNSRRSLVLRISLFILVLVLGVFSLVRLWDMVSTSRIGYNDFVGYWSATYLLKNGQNPYDVELMRSLQHTEIKTGSDSVVMAWNPPSLFVFLLPIAWMPFTTARFAFLVFNLFLVITGVLILARVYFSGDRRLPLACLLLFTLFFPPMLSGLGVGQVTFFVFFGLVASLFFIKRGAWFWAGFFLIFTSIKPHLVVLPLIYLLFYMLWERKFLGLVGLITAGLACCAVLFIFRPEWISDFIGLLKIAPVQWLPPTVDGLMRHWQVTDAARYLIVLFFPLPFFLFYKRDIFSLEFSVALLTLITIPITFFGWSFDQTILLIPVAQIFQWLQKKVDFKINIATILLLILALILNYSQKAEGINDVYYVWYPLFLWLIFGINWYVVSREGDVPVNKKLEAA